MKFNWLFKHNSEPFAKVNITHRMTVNNIACVLAEHNGHPEKVEEKITKRWVEKELRRHLHEYGCRDYCYPEAEDVHIKKWEEEIRRLYVR